MGYTLKNQGVAQTHIPKGSYSHGKRFTNPTPTLVHFLSLSLSLPYASTTPFVGVQEQKRE